MKKLLSIIAIAIALCFASCEKFDDSDIWDKLDEYGESIKDHENRISALEELCSQINTNITAMQTIIEALEKRDYITNVSSIRKDGVEVGYTISFAYGDTITIYHGKDGQDGANGENGYTPQIGVMKDIDGIYYWTLDGEWLLDGKGNKIKAVGTDGKDGEDGKDGQDGANGSNGANGTDGKDGANGQDGKDGEDGVTPRLKIEGDYWYVSYDNGVTWEKLCKATSESGSNGANGQDGKDGEDGKDGITPRLKITNGYWYVSYDNGVTWEKLGKATGEDGQDGTNGSDGTNGTNGTNGKDGQDGKDGVDGITPRLKIENDYWYVSYDNGKSWTQLGKATGEDGEDGKDGLNGSDGVNGEDGRDGDSFFRSVTQDDENVYFTLADGTVITIQKSQKANNARIYYTTSNGKIVDISNSEAFDATIISNTYKDGKGVIEFDRTITSIGQNAFIIGWYLTSITLPDSITSIMDGAFCNCGELNAFYSKFASADNRCLVIDGRLIAFAPAEVTQYNIPSNVTVIGANIFNGCSNLTAISIPNTVTEIGLGAFAGAGLTSVRVPDSIFVIGDNAFASCVNLQSVIIGNNVTTIGEEAFADCTSLTSITIPSSVISIEGGAFHSCQNLASVTIGSNVAEIGVQAFAYCPSLTSIYCKSTIPPAIYYTYYSNEPVFPLNSGLRIYVPYNSYNAYTQYETYSEGNIAQTNWYIYTSYIEPYYF